MVGINVTNPKDPQRRTSFGNCLNGRMQVSAPN